MGALPATHFSGRAHCSELSECYGLACSKSCRTRRTAGNSGDHVCGGILFCRAQLQQAYSLCSKRRQSCRRAVWIY